MSPLTGYIAPTEVLDDTFAQVLRSYLDGQRRIRGAYWVATRFVDVPSEPDVVQHSLYFDVRDGPLSGAAAAAFFHGVSRELVEPRGSTVWSLPMPEDLVELRERAVVIWEADAEPPDDLDPLDFVFLFEPLPLPAEIAALVAEEAAGTPTIETVRLANERLMKGDAVVSSQSKLYVDMDPLDDFLERVRPMQELVRPYVGGSVGAGSSCIDPDIERHSTLLYERNGLR